MSVSFNIISCAQQCHFSIFRVGSKLRLGFQLHFYAASFHLKIKNKGLFLKMKENASISKQMIDSTLFLPLYALSYLINK